MYEIWMWLTWDMTFSGFLAEFGDRHPVLTFMLTTGAMLLVVFEFTLLAKFGKLIGANMPAWVPPFFQVFSTILFAALTATITWSVISSAARTYVEVLQFVGLMLITWATLFHVAAYYGGPKLSAGAAGQWISSRWSRFIDYLYLIGSTFGILKIAVAGTAVGTDAHSTNAWGTVILGIALALRLTKTSIEIFGWDKPPKQEAVVAPAPEADEQPAPTSLALSSRSTWLSDEVNRKVPGE